MPNVYCLPCSRISAPLSDLLPCLWCNPSHVSVCGMRWVQEPPLAQGDAAKQARVQRHMTCVT
jgi:hypothetical protein